MSKYSKTEGVKVLGIDLAKEVFHLHGVDASITNYVHVLDTIQLLAMSRVLPDYVQRDFGVNNGK